MSRRRNPYRYLTNQDLSGFDERARELILRAINAGCTGKVSRKGHVILRNDSGQTTAVPRNLTSPNRTAQNSAAQLERILRTHRGTSPPNRQSGRH